MTGIVAGAVHSPRLGLHVHVTMERGAVRQVRLQRAPPGGETHPDVAPLLERLGRHLESGREDFSDVPIRLDGVGDFHRRALEHLHAHVKPGEVLS
jgi:hypothetical protein